MKVPTRNRILESLLSGRTQLGEDHSTVPQTSVDQLQSRGERKIETSHEHRATSVSTVAPQGESNRAEQRQKERVTEIYVPDESEKIDTDGIYDVPSSVLRSIHDTIGEEQASEYDQLIPISSHSAKIADGSQKMMPSSSGWDYAEIKDAIPSAPMATTQVPSHHDNTHSTSRLHYADITDALPSRQAPFVKQLPNINDTPDTDSITDMHGSPMINSDIVASLTQRSRDDPMTKNSNSEEHVFEFSVIDSEDMNHMERETPTSSGCQESKQYLEISDPEEGRNMVTPEGSEGSDVFIDQPPVTTITKSNSLPPLMSHRTQSGGGYAMTPQRGATLTNPSPRQNRSRIVSEPQPTSKPKPTKRTKISNDQPPPPLPEKPLPQLPQDPQVKPPADLQVSLPETPPPVLPEKPQPPPVLPEKPPPPLPEKPIPTLPEEPVPALPEKPLPVPPNEFLPLLPDKPPPVLPDRPPPVLPDRSPPVLPVWENTASPAPVLEQPPYAMEQFNSSVVGKSSPKLSERPPVPKPRRNLPSTSSNSPIQVRSGRSHTTATCNTVGLDSPSMPPSTHHSQEANGGSPKAFRSTRPKSSSDSQRLGTGNGSGINGQSPQHLPAENTGTSTVAYENAIFFKGKALKAAAPPVARKPKHTSTSSPGRREPSGPPTSPKPKRN